MSVPHKDDLHFTEEQTPIDEYLSQIDKKIKLIYTYQQQGKFDNTAVVSYIMSLYSQTKNLIQKTMGTQIIIEKVEMSELVKFMNPDDPDDESFATAFGPLVQQTYEKIKSKAVDTRDDYKYSDLPSDFLKCWNDLVLQINTFLVTRGFRSSSIDDDRSVIVNIKSDEKDADAQK